MAKKVWQGNKAINHELITNDPEYQQKVMLYNVLANKLMTDPRSLDPRIRQDISRANNLLNSESTSLFENEVNRVEGLFKQDPGLNNVNYKTALNLVRGPINKTASEQAMLRGWHGGEVHHVVPVGASTAITSELPYDLWGDIHYTAGNKVPVTSQAFSGQIPLSAPGHNVAHFDVIKGQFFKGEGSHGAQIIFARYIER